MALEPYEDTSERSNMRLAMYVATATAALAAVALGLGVMAVPIAGANCRKNCISYPYLDTVDRFPRDYLWMYFAVVMVVAYLLFMVSLRAVAAAPSGLVGQMAVVVAVASTVVLVATYFTQSSVVPASIAAGETEGIALITMYNPHGLFIALEEIGYLLMSVSFLLAALMVTGAGRMVRAIRWIFGAGFILPFLAFIAYAAAYGLNRQDHLEVAAIAVDWLVLIVNGILVALLLRKRLSSPAAS
ncbi:MAG: hypothetical protein WBV06_03000 [Acidimicrobiia bacterium]